MQPDILQLVPVCSECFAHKVLEEECDDQQFFVEHLPEEMKDQSPHDVILMNKVTECHNSNSCCLLGMPAQFSHSCKLL